MPFVLPLMSHIVILFSTRQGDGKQSDDADELEVLFRNTKKAISTYMLGTSVEGFENSISKLNEWK